MKSCLVKWFNFLFLAGAVGLLISSCSIEKKLAKDFVNSKKDISVLILHPDYIYRMDSYDSMYVKPEDSLSIKNSIITQVSDSIFITWFENNLVENLKACGLDAYTNTTIDSFLCDTTTSYIFNIAQMQLEEFPVTTTKYIEIDYAFYQHDLILNTININMWYEATKVNSTDSMRVLYSSCYVKDNVKDFFVNNLPKEGEAKYKFVIDKIKSEDAYQLAGFTGEKNAEYIFDYLLNEYVKSKSPLSAPPEKYYHYDKGMDKIKPAKDKFTRMQ